MSDLFTIYEDTFNIVINKVNKIIDSMQNLSKEKSEQALTEANDNLNEAERYLKQMELETETNFGKNSDRLKLKVKNYKQEYENVKRRFNNQQSQYIDKKSHDFLAENQNKNKNFKQRLIDGEEMAYENQNYKLENATRKVMGIENQAVEVVKEMNHQTKKIEGIDARTLGLNNSVDDNQDIIDEMYRREQRNKYIILGVIIILSLILITILGVRILDLICIQNQQIQLDLIYLKVLIKILLQ